jgi:hypothetical protein
MDLFSYLPKSLARLKPTRLAGKSAKPRAARRPVVVKDPIPLPEDLRRRLNNVRSGYRLVGVITGLAMLVGALSMLLLVQSVSDWWFDLPWAARAGFLLTDVVLLLMLYFRNLDGPLRTRLTMEQTALRVEKKWPQLRQSVIGAVELAAGTANSTRGSRQLVDLMLQEAREKTARLNFREILPLRPLRRWVSAGAGAVLVTAGLAFWAWPSTLPLIERICLLNVPLPTKTIVVPITRDLMVPVGSDVEISAMAQGTIPMHGRVTVTYAEGAPQEFPLTVLPDKPATFSLTLHNVQSAFKYSFHLNDGHGAEFTVSARVPPSVTNLACEQDYPAYTGVAPRKLAPTELSLLAGSHLKVSADSTDPLKSATIVLQGVTQTITATVNAEGNHLEADVPIPAKDLTGFSIHLIDQSGVSSANETIYPIVLVPDNPPAIKIIQPTSDQETITLRAKPVITFEATDDYGLAQLSINYQLIPPMVAGETDSRPPSDVQHIPIKIKPASEGHVYEYVLDVASQSPAWQEGYTVNYWIEATDNNSATGPGVTKTDHKQFGIISLEAKQAEILERLKQNAAEINSLSGSQQKINNDVGEAIPQK